MQSTLRQLARYLLTGGAAAIVDVGAFALLYRAGLPVAPAAGLSFCVAAAVNYLLTAKYVFGAGTSSRRFALFFVVALIGLAINVTATVQLSASLNLLPELAKVGGIGIAFLANFAMNKLIVFSAE